MNTGNKVTTHFGNRRMRFCSSLSSTSSVMYSNCPGKRGFTENASFASRIHTLRCMRTESKTRLYIDAHMCDSQSLQRVERLGGNKRAQEESWEDLLALSPHLVSRHAQRHRYAPFVRGWLKTHLHSTSPGPCTMLRTCSSLSLGWMPFIETSMSLWGGGGTGGGGGQGERGGRIVFGSGELIRLARVQTGSK